MAAILKNSKWSYNFWQQHILSNSIQFIGSDNVCLDIKIVIVAHLLAEIWKINFGGGHYEKSKMAALKALQILAPIKNL